MIFTDNSKQVLQIITKQYKDDFFKKLNFSFQKNKRILDVGCGDGNDGYELTKRYKLIYQGMDIFKHDNIKKYKLKFTKASILKIPYPNNSFDYVFVHDVLHHVNEPVTPLKDLKTALSELRRVCNPDGYVIICEGNRFNPIYYPHMVLQLKHNHFTYDFFIKLVKNAFKKDKISFSHFELHAFPPRFKLLYSIYDFVMEHFVPKQFLSYNTAIIQKQ